MDRMLVVVFDNETKAYEGKKALSQLDSEGSISVYGYAVLAKHADGSATIKQGMTPGRLAPSSELHWEASSVCWAGRQVWRSALPRGFWAVGSPTSIMPASVRIFSTTSARA